MGRSRAGRRERSRAEEQPEDGPVRAAPSRSARQAKYSAAEAAPSRSAGGTQDERASRTYSPARSRARSVGAEPSRPARSAAAATVNPEKLHCVDHSAAGIIVFAGQCCRNLHQVCLVNKADGWLGPPKGRGETGEDCMQNGKRERHEETGLSTLPIEFITEEPVFEKRIHYFVARWGGEFQENSSWAPPAEDPNDPNPVVRAQWMEIGAALVSERLTSAMRRLLFRAMNVVRMCSHHVCDAVTWNVSCP